MRKADSVHPAAHTANLESPIAIVRIWLRMASVYCRTAAWMPGLGRTAAGSPLTKASRKVAEISTLSPRGR
jgi:hypothetical protein